MLKKKFFPNAHLDEAKNQLVLSSMTRKENKITAFVKDINAQGQAPVEIVYRSCNCPNCGGMNKIAQGTAAECDFCGSPIEA